MTHHLELLATNQPWNLIIFMAIPVILAQTVAITELYILYTRQLDGWVRALNRVAGSVVGLYFVGVIAYLLAHVAMIAGMTDPTLFGYQQADGAGHPMPAQGR